MSGEKLIGKHGGYRKLKGFRMAQLAYDVTVAFCDRYVDKYSRTRDQMVQAARSGVQNIAEGSQASATSKKTELKLTGVARASLEELALDYEDYLRQHDLPLWEREHPALEELRRRRPESLDEFKAWVNDPAVHRRGRPEETRHTGSTGRTGQTERNPSSESSKSSASSGSTPSSVSNLSSSSIAERVANGALLLIGVACFCLDRQILALGKDFEQEGGFTERLYRIRKERRDR